jgi:histidinol-phosphate aminotransferase
MSVSDLARPEIVAMKPYSSARSEASASGILLNANESPWPLIDDPLARQGEVGPLNRYPEPQHA